MASVGRPFFLLAVATLSAKLSLLFSIAY